VQYLKEEADAPVDWKKPLTGRSSSKKAGRKRRLSLELAEKISVEAEAARALELGKRKRKEESDLLWEAKKMRSLPRPRRDASQSVVTAYNLFSKNQVSDYGFDAKNLQGLPDWTDEKASAEVERLFGRMQERIDALDGDLKLAHEENAKKSQELRALEDDERARVGIDSLDNCQWRAYTSFHDKEEYMACIGNVLATFNSKKGPQSKKSSANSWRRFKMEEKGVWMLMHLYCGLTVRFISSFFEVSFSFVARAIRKVTMRLLGWSMERIRMPVDLSEVEEMYKMQSDELRTTFPNRLLFAIDGTPIPMFEPGSSKSARQMFSFKYQKSCYRFYIIVSADGYIRYLSNAYDGSTHDATMYELSRAKEEIAAQTRRLGKPPWVIRTGEGIVPVLSGDKAYRTLRRPNGWELKITKSGEKAKKKERKKKKGEKKNMRKVGDDGDEPLDEIEENDPEQDDDGVEFTMAVAPYRTEVERTFAKIKRFRFLIKGVLKMKDRRTLEEMLYIICGIVNWQIKNRKK